jgi:hypothetical protein
MRSLIRQVEHNRPSYGSNQQRADQDVFGVVAISSGDDVRQAVVRYHDAHLYAHRNGTRRPRFLPETFAAGADASWNGSRLLRVDLMPIALLCRGGSPNLRRFLRPKGDRRPIVRG